jgi:hypothetical protein
LQTTLAVEYRKSDCSKRGGIKKAMKFCRRAIVEKLQVEKWEVGKTELRDEWPI